MLMAFLVSSALSLPMSSIWAFPGSVDLAGSGYILTHSGRLLRTACNAVKTKPRYAGLVPKGVTIPNANAGKDCSIDIAFYIIYI